MISNRSLFAPALRSRQLISLVAARGLFAAPLSAPQPPTPRPVPDATPAPVATPNLKPTDRTQAKLAEPAQTAKPIESEAKATPTVAPIATPVVSPSPVAEHLPFVITHAGSLVCISDKPFKFE